MIGNMKALITGVKEGKNYDYIYVVDLQTGSVASMAVGKGTANDVPTLKPVRIVFNAKLTKYGLVLGDDYKVVVTEENKEEGGE